MTGRESLQFRRLAEYYDAIVAHKDYRAESAKLLALVRKYGRSGGRSWLDVACGTGRHLEFLRRRYSVCGVDLSPAMLRVARRRLPGVPLTRGDMRTFRLNRRFDAVSCLYSAIGHLSSERDLARTFANLARHVKPDGVVIVEPWIDPDDFRPGMIHLVTHRGPKSTVVRLAYSSRRKHRSVVRYHYLVGEQGHGIRHLFETDIGLLVSRRRLRAIMAKAGLDARFLANGLPSGRGLLIGIRRAHPTRRVAARRRERPSSP